MASTTPARQRAFAEWRNAVRTAHQEGVKLHPAWRERFDNFLRDMGAPRHDMRLKRANGGGPFTPDNVYWSSHGG